MARKPTALADLDIAGEGLTHQDGLAERLARQRSQRSTETTPEPPSAPPPAHPQIPARLRDPNSWRRGKSLVQVAIPEDAHVELSIIAKRRRMTLSQVVKAALNDWLTKHGYPLQLPD
jgi:hypothetical protein